MIYGDSSRDIPSPRPDSHRSGSDFVNPGSLREESTHFIFQTDCEPFTMNAKTEKSDFWSYPYFFLLLLFCGALSAWSGCRSPSYPEYSQTRYNEMNPALEEGPESFAPPSYRGQSSSYEIPAKRPQKKRNPFAPIVSFLKRDTEEDNILVGNPEYFLSDSPPSADHDFPSASSEWDAPAPQNLRSSQDSEPSTYQSPQSSPADPIAVRVGDSPEIVDLIEELKIHQDIDRTLAAGKIAELRKAQNVSSHPEVYKYMLQLARSQLIPVETSVAEETTETVPKTAVPTAPSRKVPSHALAGKNDAPGKRTNKNTLSNAALKKEYEPDRIEDSIFYSEKRTDSQHVSFPPSPSSRKAGNPAPIPRVESFSNRSSVDRFARDSGRNPIVYGYGDEPDFSRSSRVGEERQNRSQFVEVPDREGYFGNAPDKRDLRNNAPYGQFSSLRKEDSFSRSRFPESDHCEEDWSRREDYDSNSPVRQVNYTGQSFVNSPRIGETGYNSRETFPQNEHRYSRERDPGFSRADSNWETHILSAMEALKTRINLAPDRESAIADEIRLRILESTLDRPRQSQRDIPGLQEPIRDFLQSEVFALATLMNEKQQPEIQSRVLAAQSHFLQGQEHLRKICPLKIRKLQFIKSSGSYPPLEDDFLGFGAYTPRIPEFRKEEIATLYMELENLSILGDETLGFNSKLSATYEIYDTTGKCVAKNDKFSFNQSLRSHRRDIALTLPLDLQKIPVGRYYVVVRIVDQNHHHQLSMDSQRIELTISATGAGEKTP